MHPAGAKNEAHGMLGKTLETKPHSTLEVEELDTDACLSISLGGLKIQGFGWEGVAKKKKRYRVFTACQKPYFYQLANLSI